jgi:hypothetical protein
VHWTDNRFEQVEGEKQLQLLICFSSYLFYGVPGRVLFLDRLMLTKKEFASTRTGKKFYSKADNVAISLLFEQRR